MLLQYLTMDFWQQPREKNQFPNTIIIMTSNIGPQVKDFGNGLGFETSSQSTVKRNWKSGEGAKDFCEFLNRVDDIVIFNNLEKKHIRKIVDIELLKLIDRINKLGYSIEISGPDRDYITEKGYDSKYGARPLNRAIQKYIEDLVAENVVNNSIVEGNKILIDKNKKEDNLELIIKEKVEN